MSAAETIRIDGRRVRLRRTARIMRWVSLGLAVLGPVALVPVWVLFERFAPAVMPGVVVGDLGLVDRIGGYAISLVPALIGAWGFTALSRLFDRLGSGDLLDAANAGRLRRVAVALIAVVPAKVAAGAALSVWLTRDAPPGAHQLRIAVSSDDLAFLAIGVLLLVLATVLREAAEIADEHRQFV